MTPTGAVIVSIFAAIWWVAGLRAAGHGPAVVWVVPLVVSAALAVAVTRLRGVTQGVDDVDEERRNRLVMIWSAAEGVAIFIAME